MERMTILGWILMVSSCTGSGLPDPAGAGAERQQGQPTEVMALPVDEERSVPKDILAQVEPWTGDFGGMVERRVIRALVTVTLTNYFLDGPRQRGITYEALKAFEKSVNQTLQSGHLKVHVVIIPVRRDQLLPALIEGRGDIAAANLTVTDERRAVVDFSIPAYPGVSEIVVTGPSAPTLEGLDSLSGQEISVRRSSSYYESLLALNEKLRRSGKKEVVLTPAEEYLEDEDLLQMVNAGLLPLAVVDSHTAAFWGRILDDITLRPDLALRTGGSIAWAFRKNSPELAAVVNQFIENNRKGTLLGNVLLNRYLNDTQWAKKALSQDSIRRFDRTVDLFRQFARQYDFDWLMLAALGFQESGLDQSVRSPAGAVGVMQLLPSTAADPNIGIPDIEKIENNIHAGTKYLRFLLDRYFADEAIDPLDRVLLTFASYNAGPARVRGLRQRAAAQGLDPNVWFDNVEVIAAREIGRETVQYVSNIYKYYIAYKQVAVQRGLRPDA